MFRFSFRKGCVIGDIYQKQWGLAAQQLLKPVSPTETTSKDKVAFATELISATGAHCIWCLYLLRCPLTVHL